MGTKSTRGGRARWVVRALLAAPSVFLACGGIAMSNAQEGKPSADGGRDASSSGMSEAGCSKMLDADGTAVENLLSQYGSCRDASDCAALSLLGSCWMVSTARSAEFLAAAAQVTQGFETGGCLAPSISCESEQVKCEGTQGKCTSVLKGSLPRP